MNATPSRLLPPTRPHRLHTRRSWCIALLAVAVCGAFTVPARAQNADAPQRTAMVEVEARFVRATEPQLRAALAPTGNGNARAILGMETLDAALAALKAQGAPVFSHSRAVTKSGKTASIESIREVRYPTEYDPSKEDATKFIPIAFETRNEGVSLEFKPVATHATKPLVELDLVLKMVKFLGFIDYSVAKPGLENATEDVLSTLAKAPLREGGMWTPLFSTQKVTTNVAITSGETIILGGPVATAGADPSRDGLDFYVFITARILPPE